MTTAAPSGKTWIAPGPGAWERDAAHQERPFCQLWLESALPAFRKGTGEAFARFGIPFSGFETVDLEGWFFGTFSPIAEEVFPARVEAAERALAERPWRAIADEWHRSVREVFVRRNRALQSVLPASLDDDGLAAHLDDALLLFSDAGTRHFFQAVAHWVGVGLLITEAGRQAGWTPERTIQALSGASPNSTAPVAALQRVATAIAADPRAGAELASDRDPASVLAALHECSPSVRDALRAYLDDYGWQVFTGFDFTHQAMIELPGLLLETIRKAGPSARTRINLLDGLRDASVASDRARLDTLIDDALIGYGLRDDDSGITIQQPIGLVRRALLEAGARLAGRGALRDADDIFDATAAELTPLLTGAGERPSTGELARRAARRRNPGGLPPRCLGDEDPPPGEPLPAAMETIMGALFAAMALEDTPDEAPPVGRELRGAGASAGVYEGRARLVRGEGDFERLERGDVLVAAITTPAYNVVLSLIGAVVTDRGGILSHPAIVAREYGIAAVVGTGNATTRIPDGARIRVDGVAGTVTILD